MSGATLGDGSLDLGRSHRHAIAFDKLCVPGDRLTVDPDEEVLRLAVRQLLVEQLFGSKSILDVDEVSEAGSVIVDEHNSHWCSLSCRC